MQNDVLATGIMSFVMHEVVYFGRSLPWIIIDCIPYFRKYKIQHVSLDDCGGCKAMMLMNATSKKSLLQRNNGNAQCWSCSAILL
jgi:hypothetical protein